MKKNNLIIIKLIIIKILNFLKELTETCQNNKKYIKEEQWEDTWENIKVKVK